MAYDCKIEAANRLADKIREWIPGLKEAKAGVFSDELNEPILDVYKAAGIKDITVTSDLTELPSQVFDIVSLSFANCPPDEALYLVYDLFKQRRFSDTSLLCTNFSGESYAEYLEERIRGVMNQDSVEGYFMNIPREDRGKVMDNICNMPLTSVLMLCSRADYKLTAQILDIDFEPEPKAELKLPAASQVVQQVNIDMTGRRTRARAIQCSVEQGEQIIYAAFSDKAMPYTVQDVTSFFYEDNGSEVNWDIIMISDCAGMVENVKSLIMGRDPQGGYVLKGSGREYSANLRDFSELSRQYDKNLKKMYSLIRMLGERDDITLPFITLKYAKQLLQAGVPPETILEENCGVTFEEMESLKKKYYVQPKAEVVVMSKTDKTDVSGGSNEGGTEGSGKSGGEDEIVVKYTF